MYDYRRKEPVEQAAIVAWRDARGFPWHSPPHDSGITDTFFLTAACFEHRRVLELPARLCEYAEAVVQGVQTALGAKVFGWVVLPNHYHLLAKVNIDLFRHWIGRLHNGKSTQWNREDLTPGRKVWLRFTDRRIRSAGHYYASLNYIHANPVKHGYVCRADDWPWSSFHQCLQKVGRDTLQNWWRDYPVDDYGKGWDV